MSGMTEEGVVEVGGGQLESMNLKAQVSWIWY